MSLRLVGVIGFAGLLAATAVGQTRVTVTLPQGGTVATVAVLTQGVAGLDFRLAGAGPNACAAGADYAAGATCTVDYSFTDSVPGARIGAVVLYDTSNKILGETPIAAAGSVQFATFSPASTPATAIATNQSLFASGAIATDGAGTVYIADSAHGRILREAAGQSNQATVLMSGLPAFVETGYANGATGLAVDGAGNLWIADMYGTELIKVPNENGTLNPADQVVFNGNMSPSGVVVDTLGNIFFSDFNNGGYWEIPGGVGTPVVVRANVLPSGGPYGIAVDPSGNIYLADHDNSAIWKMAPGPSSTVTRFGSGFREPQNVASDSLGNIYVADTGNGRIVAYDANGNLRYTLSPGGNFYPSGLWATPGAVYTTSPYFDQTAVEYNFQQSNPLNFPAESLGGVSPYQAATLTNTGAQILHITAFSLSQNYREQSPAPAGECFIGLALAPGGSCTITLAFAPTLANYANGIALITDDSGGVAGSEMVVPLFATLLDSPTSFTLVAGSPQSAALGSAYAVPLSVQVKDAEGNELSGIAVQFTAPASGASIAFINGTNTFTAATDAQGTATIFDLPVAVGAGGSFTVTASLPGTPSLAPVSFALTNTGGATQLVLGTPNGRMQGANGGSVAVELLNASSQVVNISEAVTAVLSGPAGFAPVTVTETTVGGVATFDFSQVTLSRPGNYTVTGTAAGTPGATSNFAVQPTQLSLPNEPVGTRSGPERVTFAFPAPTRVYGTAVVVMGASNSSELTVATNSCNLVGPPLRVCTVQVTFAPAQVGLRRGAVVLLDANNNALATVFLTGTGIAPLVAYAPAPPLAMTAPGNATQIADAGAGNVYLAAGGEIAGIPTNGSAAPAPVVTGLARAGGVAVDGRGALYYTDSAAGTLNFVPRVNGALQPQNTTALLTAIPGLGNLALDAVGDLFVAVSPVSAAGYVLELPFNGNGPDPAGAFTIATGLGGRLGGMALDGLDNLWVVDQLNESVRVITGVGVATPLLSPTALFTCAGCELGAVAVDAAGDVYFGDAASGTLYREAASSGNQAIDVFTVAGLGGGDGLTSLLIGSQGDVLISASTAALYDVGFSTPAALVFPQTPVGSASAAQSVTAFNVGNAPLGFGGIGFDVNFPSVPNSGSPCAGSAAPGSGCTFTSVFAPQALGNPVLGAILIGDNALNAPSPQNVVESGVAVANTQTINFTLASNVTYAGQTIALAATGGASGNPVTFSIVGGVSPFGTLAGNQLVITGAGTITIAADEAGNGTYQPAAQVVRSLVVSPATLSAGLTGQVTRLYDGTAIAALAPGNYTLTGIVGSDAVALNNPPLGSFDTPNAGPGKTVSVSGLALTGASAANYTLAMTTASAMIGFITPAPLRVTADSFNIVYGSPLPVFTASLSGFVNHETAGVLGGAPAFTTNTSSPLAAGSFTITPDTGGISDGNYAYTFVPGSLIIQPKPLTASLIGVSRKVYDGTTAAALTGANFQLAGIVGADAVGLNEPGAGTYDTANAGAGKTVSVSGLTLGGAQAANYTLASGSASGVIGAIDPAPLTVTANNFTITYGDAMPAMTAAYSGFVNGETAAVLGGAPTFLVNNPLPLAAGVYTILTSQGGILDPNYSCTFVPGLLTIKAKPLTASLVGVSRKTYDGTSAAPLTPANFELNGIVGGDAVVLNDPPVGTFDTPNAGSGKTVSVSGLAIAGPEATSYTLAVSANGVIGEIDPAPLTITANSFTITYGDALPVLTAAYSGFVNGEAAAVLGGAPTFLVNNPLPLAAGIYTILTSQGGILDPNYSCTFVPGLLTIKAKPLTASLVGVSRKTYDGTSAAPLTPANFDLNGIVGADAVVLNDPPVGTFDTPNAGSGKTVSVSGLTLAGPQATSYTLAGSANAVIGEIDPAPLTIAANSFTITYGDALPALTASYSGFVNGETAAVLGGAPALSAALPQPLTAGSFAITASQGTISDGNYGYGFAAGTLMVNKAAQQIEVTAPATAIFGQATTLAASGGGSGEPVVLTVVSGPGVLNGAVLTPTDVGVITLAANQSGNGDYLAAPTVTFQAQALPAPQTITFPALGTATYPGGAVALHATASSGLPVSYQVSGPATLSSAGVTPTGVGQVAVTATQAGDAEYLSAAPVTVTFAVGYGLPFALVGTSSACASLSLEGGARVDSYDSAVGIAAGIARSGGNLATNGNLLLNGGAAIFGSLADPLGQLTGDCDSRAQATTAVEQHGHATLASGIVTLPAALHYAAPTMPVDAVTAQQHLDGDRDDCHQIAGCSLVARGHFALAPGNYGDLAFEGRVTVDLSQGTYVINRLTVSGDARIQLTSGPVLMELAGADARDGDHDRDDRGGNDGGRGQTVLQLTDAAINLAGTSAGLQIVYAGSGAIQIAGHAAVQAVLYAPAATIALTGDAQWYGAIVSSRATLADGAVHYDRSLSTAVFLWP